MVLIVDDDADLRRLVRAVLEPRGYRVVEAADGREGIAAVCRETPRLIVLDYMMPTLDGEGFLHELDALMSRRPPVILFTAITDHGHLVRRLAVDVFVEKPVDLLRFLKLVDATMRGAPQPVRAPTRDDGRDRRMHHRYPHRQAIEVRLPNRPGTAPAFTLDVSQSGMCVELHEPMPPAVGGYLAIIISVANGACIELDARVRYAGGGRVGVQFFAMDAPRQLALAQLLATLSA